MWRLLFGAMTAFALLSSTGAAAQQKPRLQILVEDLFDDAAFCGIDRALIESTSALTLRDSGVIVAAQSNPYLYVRVNGTRLSAGGCAFNLHVSVRATSPPPSSGGAFTVRRGASKRILCENGVFGVSPRAEIPAHLDQGLEHAIKLCLGELAY